MAVLTQREHRVYRFVQACKESNGVSPTIREIANQVGLRSSASVHRILRILEEKQLITRDRKWRSASVVPAAPEPHVRRPQP